METFRAPVYTGRDKEEDDITTMTFGMLLATAHDGDYLANQLLSGVIVRLHDEEKL